MNKRNFTRLLAGSAAGLALPALVSAQSGKGVTPDIANRAGADREQWLHERAKKEGPLLIYTSAQSNDMGAVVAGFQKKYGLQATMWRSSSENVLQRALTEARAGRNTVDVLETNGPELESMGREKILQPVQSPYLSQLIPQALRPGGNWVGTRLNVFVQAYNTKLVKKEELPNSWEDLTNPRWKGRLGIEQEDQDWLQGMSAQLGEAKAIKLFKQIVATNGMSVRKGHTPVDATGGLGRGADGPDGLQLQGGTAQGQGSANRVVHDRQADCAAQRRAVARMAPNPHAAVLFYDFEISEEGQQILAGRDFVPVSTKIDTPFKNGLQFVDAAVMLDERDKWDKLYAELFAGKTS